MLTFNALCTFHLYTGHPVVDQPSASREGTAEYEGEMFYPIKSRGPTTHFITSGSMCKLPMALWHSHATVLMAHFGCH